MISMSDDTHPSSDTGVSGWFQRLVQGRGGDAKTRDEIAEFLAGFMERGVIGADEFAMLQGVLEVAGVQNVLTKCLGTRNPHNLVKATVDGLRRLRMPSDVAARRGMTLDEIFGRARRADGA